MGSADVGQPYLFDPDDLSDMPLRLLAAKFCVKLFLNTSRCSQLTVETDSWNERDDGSAGVHLSFTSRVRASRHHSGEKRPDNAAHWHRCSQGITGGSRSSHPSVCACEISKRLDE